MGVSAIFSQILQQVNYVKIYSTSASDLKLLILSRKPSRQTWGSACAERYLAAIIHQCCEINLTFFYFVTKYKCFCEQLWLVSTNK